MTKAIIGRKIGMTSIFAPDGSFIPVTVVEAGPCVVTQIKTAEKDGYSAVQVAFEDIQERKLTKAELGHLKKANVPIKAADKKDKKAKNDLYPGRVLKEFKYSNAADYAAGRVITCEIFENGDSVDVSGLTRGRGFTGAVQRWNIAKQRMSHGAGPTHRHIGSMGANSTPSRVFKGKKMAGRYGHEACTIQNLEIVKVDAGRNVLLIKGSVPGPKGSYLTVKQAVKGGN
jgi:large subunit ribosomal protein L3